MYVHIEKKCLKMVVPLMMALALIACSKKAYIDVDYRLPADTDALAGRTVTIETRDLRVRCSWRRAGQRRAADGSSGGAIR